LLLVLISDHYPNFIGMKLNNIHLLSIGYAVFLRSCGVRRIGRCCVL
jgi:hypothetical protein